MHRHPQENFSTTRALATTSVAPAKGRWDCGLVLFFKPFSSFLCRMVPPPPPRAGDKLLRAIIRKKFSLRRSTSERPLGLWVYGAVYPPRAYSFLWPKVPLPRVGDKLPPARIFCTAVACSLIRSTNEWTLGRRSQAGAAIAVVEILSCFDQVMAPACCTTAFSQR